MAGKNEAQLSVMACSLSSPNPNRVDAPHGASQVDAPVGGRQISNGASQQRHAHERPANAGRTAS